MRKILLILVSLWSITTYAQKDSLKDKLSGYVSVGLSLTNIKDSSNFKKSSYSGIEGGIMYKNFTAGIMIGRGNLNFENDRLSEYFYEVKTTASIPIGMINGSIIFGLGGYMKPNSFFIEYGVGISYTKNKLTYGISYTNWDGTNYITPSLTYNFIK